MIFSLLPLWIMQDAELILSTNHSHNYNFEDHVMKWTERYFQYTWTFKILIFENNKFIHIDVFGRLPIISTY